MEVAQGVCEGVGGRGAATPSAAAAVLRGFAVVGLQSLGGNGK